MRRLTRWGPARLPAPRASGACSRSGMSSGRLALRSLHTAEHLPQASHARSSAPPPAPGSGASAGPRRHARLAARVLQVAGGGAAGGVQGAARDAGAEQSAGAEVLGCWPAAAAGLTLQPMPTKRRCCLAARPVLCPTLLTALHTRPAQVLLCVLRLPQHGSDVLITLNSPIFISEHSAAAEHAGACGVKQPAWATMAGALLEASVASLTNPLSPFLPQAPASKARTSRRQRCSGRCCPASRSMTGPCLAAAAMRHRSGLSERPFVNQIVRQRRGNNKAGGVTCGHWSAVCNPHASLAMPCLYRL